MRRLLMTALLIAACTLLATSAQAGSEDRLLGLSVQGVVKGRDKPAIAVEPGVPVTKLAVELTREDGAVIKLRSGKIRVGQRKVMAFKQPVGVFTYSAAFSVVWGDGDTSEFTTTFQATRVGDLRLDIGPGDVDMDERHLTFKITNPARSAELVVVGERGRRLGVFTETYEDTRPGEPLELSWEAIDGDIIRMDLKVTDVAGFYVGMIITPFSIEIPHEEVVFDTGKAVITDTEAPKLERTLEHIREALAKHGTLLELKLFVAGYTDTVGGPGPNRELSLRRARSIAAWFRKRGLKIVVYYAGFGEDVLAVQTPDETDEAANRRAVYVLSGQSPTGAAFPGAQWKRL